MASGASQSPYDPRSAGANCDACPLNTRKPVAPNISSKPRLVIVNPWPSRTDESMQTIMSGEQGKCFNRGLEAVNVTRDEIHITNVVACRVDKSITNEELKRAKACCKPRLESELRMVPSGVWALAMGAPAIEALTGKRGKVEAWSGGPLESTESFAGRMVLGTYAPEYLIKPKGRAYSPVFIAHLKRALMLSDGQLPRWEWPAQYIDPGAEMETALWTLLKQAQAGEPIGVDVETDGIDPRGSNLRCIGMASRTLTVCVPLPWQSEMAKQYTLQLLATHVQKCWQNGQFDRQVFKAHGIPVEGPHEDTLLLHAVAAPQLMHGLGVLAGIESHAENWKSDYHGSTDEKGVGKFKTKDEAELREMRDYCSKDAFMQRWLYGPLSYRVEHHVHRGMELYGTLRKLDHVCEAMGEWGVRQNKPAVERWRQVLGDELALFSEKIAQAAKSFGVPNLNPNSPKQLQALYFEKFRVAPVRWSIEGKPSLNAEALEIYASSTNQAAATFSRAMMAYREKAKLLSTYVRGDDTEDEDGSKRRGLRAGEDGRYHFNWKAWGTVTWRFASSPNAQNIPNIILSSVQTSDSGAAVVLGNMRDIFMATEGMTMAAADQSQLEARIVAMFANATKLLEWYRDGQDVHTLNAKAIFNRAPTKTERDLVKKFLYASLYGASTDTIWKRLVVDVKGLTLRQVEFLHRAIFETHPQIPQWQARQLARARQLNYVEEEATGSRAHFYGNVDPTVVYNFPVQRFAAKLMNDAILAIEQELGPDEHFLFNIHDELVYEGPDAGRLKGLLVKHMTKTVRWSNGAEMGFVAEPKSGQTLAECK